MFVLLKKNNQDPTLPICLAIAERLVRKNFGSQVDGCDAKQKLRTARQNGWLGYLPCIEKTAGYTLNPLVESGRCFFGGLPQKHLPDISNHCERVRHENSPT